jgi:hypothetical protein
MMIHFFDLPVFCGLAGALAGPVAGVATVRVCDCCGSAAAIVATITGLFGSGAATARSVTFGSDFVASSPLLAKAAGSTRTVIIDTTTRKIVDGIHVDLSFDCELGFIRFPLSFFICGFRIGVLKAVQKTGNWIVPWCFST